MTDRFGPGFIDLHKQTALRLTPLLQTEADRPLDWTRIERDLEQAASSGRAALATDLVQATGGFLAMAGGLGGECVDCALQPLQQARVLRPADRDAALAALDCAASLAVGLLRDPSKPDGVTVSQWLRGCWSAAHIAHRWASQQPAA